MGPAKPETGGRPPGGYLTGWLLLLFFASASMFVVGILVGRSTAPVNFDMENLDSKLSELEVSVLADRQADGGREKQMPDDVSFDFYEKLKEKNEIDEHAAGRPRVLAPKHEKPEPSEITLKKTAPGEKTRTGTQERIAELMNQEAGYGQSREKSEEDPEKKFAIQVASLRDAEKAEQVRSKFSDKGYPAFTRIAFVEGKGRWCRVRLGPYTERKQAEDDLARLQKAGVDAMIILND